MNGRVERGEWKSGKGRMEEWKGVNGRVGRGEWKSGKGSTEEWKGANGNAVLMWLLNFLISHLAFPLHRCRRTSVFPTVLLPPGSSRRCQGNSVIRR